MSTEFHDRVRQVLERVVQLTPTERERLIQRSCGDDSRLLEEVRSLLPHYETAQDSDLKRPCGADWALPGTTAFTAAGEEAAATESPEPDLVPPFCLDRYTVFEVLGCGGMGVVYHAVDAGCQRRVAIKILRRGLLSQEHRRRFILEAEILRQLRHPGIARILRAGFASIERQDTIPIDCAALPYFVMEYISGVSLTEFAEQRNLSVCGRLALLAKVCEAVQFAHHRGIVHRDLKPDNILVESSGHPRVLDFGIAHILAFQTDLLGNEEGGFTGTLEYASPEQLAGDMGQLAPRSDVYTLGLIAHELLTGALPRRECDGLHLNLGGIQPHLDYPAYPGRPGEFQRALARVLATALRTTIGPSYDTAGEFGAEIERLLAHSATRSRWAKMKDRLLSLVTSRSGEAAEGANRPLSAVLRQRIAMAVESERYRSAVPESPSKAQSSEPTRELRPSPERTER